MRINKCFVRTLFQARAHCNGAFDFIGQKYARQSLFCRNIFSKRFAGFFNAGIIFSTDKGEDNKSVCGSSRLEEDILCIADNRAQEQGMNIF